MSDYLFVTGAPRSGTTLLDKLLSRHPDVHVLSQPLPLLYVEVKREFLRTRAESARTPPPEPAYPLGDVFGQNYYRAADFLEFLQEHRLSRSFLRDVLGSMKGFSGQYTKPKDLPEMTPGADLGLYQFVYLYTSCLVPDRQVAVIGSKETYAEEYIPYFLSHRARVLLIVRDPRDVMASLNHGSGREFGGRKKPHLFNVRQWRKSVAFALRFGAEPDFMVLRYEDLVRTPKTVLNQVGRFLNLHRFPNEVLDGHLQDQSGELWESNSSHFAAAARVTPRSVGSYRKFLDLNTERFVQAACFPELQYFGYSVDITGDQVIPTLEGYVPEEELERPELAEYSWSTARLREERERWERLRSGVFESGFFLFEQAFSSLRGPRFTP